MRFMNRPVTGVLLGVLLVVAGLYTVANSAGGAAVFGWVFVVVGVLGAVVNLLMLRRQCGAGGRPAP